MINVEERSLIHGFLKDTRKETVENILAAYPVMQDEFKTIAESAANKLNRLTETQFMSEIFVVEEEDIN